MKSKVIALAVNLFCGALLLPFVLWSLVRKGLRRLGLLTALGILVLSTGASAQSRAKPLNVEKLHNEVYRWWNVDSVAVYMTDFYLWDVKTKVSYGRARVTFTADPVYDFRLRYFPPPGMEYRRRQSFWERWRSRLVWAGLGMGAAILTGLSR